MREDWICYHFHKEKQLLLTSCLLLRMKMPYHFMVCYLRTEFASKGANSFKELRWGNENHSVASPGSVLR